MQEKKSLMERDLAHIWHPASQMQTYELFAPLVIAKAEGNYLELEDGRKIIDAISSWWCKSLGHGHPRLKKALLTQIEKFEHVILANTTYERIVGLSEKLAALMPGLNKVFYASDGASAIEIALKMSLHARLIQGDAKRKHFIALENGYHGETIGALSVSDSGKYRAPYEALLFETHFIKNVPYVLSVEDPLWSDCADMWPTIEKSLEPYINTATALIVEPLIQGAAGMKLYSADFLKRLRVWTAKHHIHLIADEIMTGIGRTGKMLACEWANVIPDFLCLSKGLTSGWLPLSAVLIEETIYDLFYAEPSLGKNFLHSHTYSGNALAVAVAAEVLAIFEEEALCEQANQLGKIMRKALQAIGDKTGKLVNIRGIGAIAAADLVDFKPYTSPLFAKIAAEKGALLRLMGNTLYWLPPLNMDLETLEELGKMTEEAIRTYFEAIKPN